MDTQEDADFLHRETYHEHPLPYEVGQVVTLPPCISLSDQEMFMKEMDRVCPRVELLPGNGAAASLAWLLIQPSMKAAYTAMALAYSKTLPSQLFQKAVSRSIEASRSKLVVDTLDRLEKSQAQKAEKAGKR